MAVLCLRGDFADFDAVESRCVTAGEMAPGVWIGRGNLWNTGR